MSLQDIASENRAYCRCGEDLQVRVHEDPSNDQVVVRVSVHGLIYDRRHSGYELHGGPRPICDVLAEDVYRARHCLAAKCPGRVDFHAIRPDEVVESDWEAVEVVAPDGTRFREMMRRERQHVSTTPMPPAPRPSIAPNFGKPAARRIVK